MIWPILGTIFSKKTFLALDFLKPVSVIMTDSSEKTKMKKFYLILVSPTDFLKTFLPLPIFWHVILPSKKGMGGGEKLMCFHLRIYLKLFNSSCVFLLEHIDVFWMFLLLSAIKNKTIIQNKTEDWHSVTSSNWVRLTNLYKVFKPSKPTRQLSFWEFKILRWLNILDYTLQNALQDHTSLASFFRKIPI